MNRFRLLSFLISIFFFSACIHSSKNIDTNPDQLNKSIVPVVLNERMKFSIRWLGLEVGTVDVWVKEIVKIRERDAYHVDVRVRSNKIIDLIYPVKQEHHSYIDAKHFYSLRYEVNSREGHHYTNEMIDYDQESHTARYESRRSGDIKEMLIPKNVQDQLSCTFWFRAQPMRPGEYIRIPVNMDEKNWKLEVEVQAIEMIEIDGFGKIAAIRAEPFAQFSGLFVRRGRAWGWMSADERRIPLMMKTKIPILGTITMIIKEYSLGDYHVKA